MEIVKQDHHATSATFEKALSGSESRRRHRVIAIMLQKSRLVRSLPAFEPDELEMQVSAWAEILEPIPTEWLDECYKRAMRSHNNGQPFASTELVRIWHDLCLSGEVAKATFNGRCLPAAHACDYNCSPEGWVIVDETGNPISSSTKGPTFVKACPVHRQQLRY